MNENKQDQTDPRLDTPSENNREKHINFHEVEEESAQNFAIKNTSERQKEWQQEIKEGEEEKLKLDQRKNTSSRPMDENDTVGVP